MTMLFNIDITTKSRKSYWFRI